MPARPNVEIGADCAEVASTASSPAAARGVGAYVDSLVFSDREKRLGFPDEVATELFRLSNVHQALNPTMPVSRTGWEKTDDADLSERKRQPTDSE